MAYTKHRLQEALRVFREARSNDRHNQVKANQQSSKYAFRRVVPASSTRHLTAYRDSDSSGEEDDDYDPSSKRKKKRVPDLVKLQRQKRRAEDGGENGGQKRAKGMPRDTAMRDSKEAYITVVLTSEKGKELLQDLGQKHGNDVIKKRRLGRSFRIVDQSLDPMQRDLESRRKAQTYMDTLDLECAMIDNNDCRALRNRKVPDAKSEPRKVPCNSCSEAKVKCRGFIRGVCQRCKQEDLDCVPYRKDRNHPKRKGAATLPTPRSSGMSLDSDMSVIDLDHPTTPWQGSNTGNAIVIDQDGLREIGKKTTSTIELDSGSEKSPIGRTFNIKTFWAHPIDFQYFPNPTIPPCDFCSDCLFGIHGHGPVNVEILQLPGEEAYQELGNGHRADGKAQTVMCVRCALQRLYILHCRSHTFEPIPGVDYKSFRFQDYADQMRAEVEGLKPRTANFKYAICSICPSPAFFRCCTKQGRDITGQPLHPHKKEKGCGLLVCPTCLKPIEAHKGLLREWYMRQHAQAVECGGGIRFYRADAEFLYPGSLLRKAYSKFPADTKSDC